MPAPHPFGEPAAYQGKPLAFYFSAEYAATATSLYLTTMQIFVEPPFRPLGSLRTQSLPENRPSPGQTAPNYLTDIGPDVGRSALEYLNVRRKVRPGGQMSAPGEAQSWPTTAPMTDEELGIVAVPGRGYLPWDGVRGPQLPVVGGEQVIDYPKINHTDYLETADKFTAVLTGAVDHDEYTARVLAMAQIYWALGIRFADYRQHKIGEALDLFQAAKAQWTVLSFRAFGARSDSELAQAEAKTGIKLMGRRRYRFVLYQWTGKDRQPEDVRRVLVHTENQVIAYADLTNVLLGRGGGKWTLERVPH